MLSILVLLALRTWATAQGSQLPALRVVHVTGDGRVLVPLGDRLYVESAAGASLDVVPLERLGLTAVRGDLAVLSDGSVLLRQEAEHGDAPLQRCDLVRGTCRPLAGGLHVGLAFRLAVDEAQGRIRVADTPNHRLVLADLEGHVLREHAEGCSFPSAVTPVEGGELLVSNQNRASVIRVAGAEADFGAELEETSVRDWSQSRVHTRPKGIAVAADGARWVVLTDARIANGQLYRVGADGGTAARVALPEGSDTMYPAVLGDTVLLPDEGLLRIHHFALDGTRLEDFGSPELRAALAGLLAHGARMAALERWSLVALLALAVPMLLVALWLQRRATAASAELLGRGSAPVALLDPALRERAARGEAVFRRRYSVLSGRDARRVSLVLALVGLPLLGLLASLVGTVTLMLWKRGLPLWPMLGPAALLVLTLGLTGAWGGLSARRERLRVDARGVHYTSFLGLLGRDWHVPWEAVEGIVLRPALGGRVGAAWYYELRERSGRKRLLNALSWRPEGEDEVGVALSRLPRLDARYIQGVVHDTQLFQVLSAHLPASPGDVRTSGRSASGAAASGQ